MYWRLPANPKLRLSANDLRSEAIIFLVFCCLNIFSYPLMAQGFWARYNRGFATYEHLNREMKRKPGDYSIDLITPEGDSILGVYVAQKANELVLFRNGKFERYDTDKVRLLNFLKKRNKYRHQFVTINLLHVSTDSLNRYMTLPVVKVTAQSEQELYYFEGPIMKKGNELSADYPNGARFQQLAVDNAQTKFELEQIELEHRAERLRYNAKVAELERHRADLYEHANRSGLSDYEEGKRRDRIRELTAKIAEFEQPEPINTELYEVRKQMLEHKLREIAHLNATLLIWQAQESKN